jgi:uroporphyrinogen-III synthase
VNGERILVTRARSQAHDLQTLLRRHGATALAYPCIAFQLQRSAELDRALYDAASGCFDWIVFTSANAVQAVVQRLRQLALAADSLRGAPLAVVGPATRRAVQRGLGLDVQTMPDEYLDQALVAALGAVSGQQILVLQAERGSAKLTQQLTAHGANVRGVATCETRLGSGGVHLSTLLTNRQLDGITLTSPSIVRNFVQRLALEQADRRALDPVCLACIGPTTAQAARELGLPVTVVPSEYTIDGLVAALEQHFAERPALRTRTPATSDRYGRSEPAQRSYTLTE